jgi:hypothetical protein
MWPKKYCSSPQWEQEDRKMAVVWETYVKKATQDRGQQGGVWDDKVFWKVKTAKS